MKKVTNICIILVFTISLFLPASKVSATTLKEYEDQVAKYTKELQDKESKIAKNDAEVAQIKKNIANIESQITAAETEIQNLKEEIVKSEEEIKKKSEESKNLMEYFQITDGENAYLEYAFGADTITDMIYRVAVVEQLTEYNEQVMKELRELIDTNKAKTEELAKVEENLKKLKADLQDQKERIQQDTDSLKSFLPSIKEQIKIYQNQVTYWKNKGCKSNDVLGVTCAVPPKVTSSGTATNIIGANGFRVPMDHGYLTQGYYGKGGHMGIDLGSSNKSEPIYPVANGLVIYVGRDSYGAHVVKIVHNVNGSLLFSTYAHMREVYFKKNQTVTTGDMLGLMGSTGNSTGPHLHLEMTTCDWTYNCTYSTYKNSLVNPFSYIPKVTKW